VTDPIWITTLGFLYLHEETLAFHGGKSGLRDLGLLEAAISRAQNVFVYQGINDPARLAAAYAFGITRNHPFFDGNKRAAFAAIGLFLGKNGFRFTAQQNDATQVLTALAAGTLSEEELAKWIQQHLEE
jgi:death-on-curing protein